MKNLQLESFNFNLNENLIAQHPLKNRDDSKLLHINGNNLHDMQFKQLTELLNPNDVIIFNNTKVVPTKLIAKNITGATFNITLHKQLSANTWLAFIKNCKKLKENTIVTVAEDFLIKIIKKLETGDVEVELLCDDSKQALEKYGFMPLPPYIKRDNNPQTTLEDKQRYQSVFAKKQGAVASPTASLHFSDTIINKIKELGVKIGFVTLHVGAGTFLPVKTQNITEHKMHSEFGELPQETIQLINNCQQNNGKVIAVGTTALRVLEYVHKQHGQLVPFAGDIDLFVYPPYNFKVVDCLLTNFHLPQSTLFMLVCAFGGTEQLKLAYQHATNNNYRFFSYGDACFINKNKDAK